MSTFGNRIFHRVFGGQKDDLVGLCKDTVSTIDAYVKDDLGGADSMLNPRQCSHLSRQLSEILFNVEELLSQCKESRPVYLKSALESFFRYLEKARVLVEKCGEKNWLGAAVFQSGNENAFREILLDIGCCYHAIYEQARSLSEDWSENLSDLRTNLSTFLLPDDDVDQDRLDLQRRLEAFVDDSASARISDNPLSVEKSHCLANYLLVKMQFSCERSHGGALDASSPLFWQKETEPKETWGSSKYLGAGATEGGVCSTTWLGTSCAKKEFHVKEYESLFLKEAGVMAYLKHPCVIDFICCSNGQEKGDRFIAMELMETSLSDLIEDQAGHHFSLPVVVDIITQIARGMRYLHDLGVAHRDLKPQNVVVNRLAIPLLGEYICAKLVDYGSSKIEVEASKSNIMTYCGVGSKLYRAPEVHPAAHPKARSGIRGKVNWFQADVFSFAMTCAHILTLKTPFQGMEVALTVEELFNAIMNGVRPNLAEKNVLKIYPEELLALLSECWNTVPRRRPSFADICKRLEIVRQILWRGYVVPNSSKPELAGSDFINMIMEKQSSIQRNFTNGINQAPEIHDEVNDNVDVLPCFCGCVLQVLDQPPHERGRTCCDVCQDVISGKDYRCGTCDFDAHPECVEIEDKVEVFFHHHSLHLLIRYYYKNNLDVLCRLCEKSLQHSEWVYRCEQCDFDAHALCTKRPKEIPANVFHVHPLTIIHSHPRKTVLSTCCSTELKGQGWRYKCVRKSCAFEVHPDCISFRRFPLCIFDRSHRLQIATDRRVFHCGRCGTLGYSWYYECIHCNVELHLDCIDDIDERETDWDDAYENFMIEYEMMNDDHMKLGAILKLLDKTLVNVPLEASSSSSSSKLQVMPKVQPSTQRLQWIEESSLDVSVKEKLLGKVAAESEERKAKKMATIKEGRQKLKVKLFDNNGNLKKLVQDLQSSKTCCNDEDFSTRVKNLEERLCTMEQDENVGLGQWQMRQSGPRIVLFYMKEPHSIRRLLTSLQANKRRSVYYVLLCEEPGHEHIVDGVTGRRFIETVLGDVSRRLQPLFTSGLQLVATAVETSPLELSTREYVTLPIFGGRKFDVQDIDLNMYGLQKMNSVDDTQKQALKVAENLAVELFSNYLDDTGIDIFKSCGLQRVRYRVTEESSFPHYTPGMVAWLCKDHLKTGLEGGILEPYPSMYYNPRYDNIRD